MNREPSFPGRPRRAKVEKSPKSLARLLCYGFLAMPLLMFGTQLHAKDVVRVGGTGIGLAFARIVGEQVKEIDNRTEIEVLPSLGSSGGIKALIAGDIDVAVSARPLRDAEIAKGVYEAACMTTALVFATSRPSAPGIALSQLTAIYGEAAPSWPDGQRLKIILRSRAGSENPYLAKLVPGLDAVFDRAYKRPGLPIGATDQENAELVRRTEGSFGIMTLLQIRAEDLSVTPITVNGIAPSAETLADRTYPMPISVCFLFPGSSNSGAIRFGEFLRSSEGQKLSRLYGAEPSE